MKDTWQLGKDLHKHPFRRVDCHRGNLEPIYRLVQKPVLRILSWKINLNFPRFTCSTTGYKYDLSALSLNRSILFSLLSYCLSYLSLEKNYKMEYEIECFLVEALS